mmetsp:Transcript_19567/g.34546  ORF Transcript_19567/g.34546 Transcript_19567/m.34546 type:complete len:699 (+) Transcript_19567:22-2118(+)
MGADFCKDVKQEAEPPAIVAPSQMPSPAVQATEDVVVNVENEAGSEDKEKSSPDEAMQSARPEARSLASKVSVNDQLIAKRVEDFEKERMAARKAYIKAIAGAGLSMIVFAIIVLGIGAAAYSPYAKMAFLLQPMLPLGHFWAAAGICALSCIPLDDLDIDEFLAEYPFRRWFLWIMLFGLSFVQPEPIMGCIGGAIAFFAAMAAFKSTKNFCLNQTTFLCVWMIVRLCQAVAIEWRTIYVPAEDLWNSYTKIDRPGCEGFLPSWVSLGVLCPSICVLATFFLWLRRPSARHNGRKYPRTLVVWRTVHLFMLIWGVYLVASVGAFYFQSEECFSVKAIRYRAVAEIASGCGTIFPVLIVLIFGRDVIFRRSAHRIVMAFEMSQSESDGVFIAELLADYQVEVGDEWWVHHGQQKPEYPRFDPRKNWTRAEIMDLMEDRFTIEKMDTKESSKEEVMWPHNTLPPGEMLDYAKKSLRCIRFEDIEMAKNRLFFSDEAEVQTTLTATKLTGGNLFDLSHQLAKGEQIDYFMSHSWHDNAKVKWGKLKEFAEQFKESNNRYPSFWLDNVCIDQSKITDGLRVLPINLMSCKKLLIVAGKTYPTRLWCAWELLVLFAFTGEQETMNRVDFIAVEDEDGSEEAIINDMKTFDVLDAKCYDPNEERKLRRVIDKIGVEKFNARIRNLGSAVEEKQKKAKRSRSIF